ncbi:MAG: ribosome small subunit-dependent GTPase A [Proteobacteria bacterium]|nr:ribosome small subunit-dependent GTPase A [Pseudomonadota bacterium]MDA0926458.1 ribosome small subunit-dependent GTPase A [Pseudomonadota bacterium]
MTDHSALSDLGWHACFQHQLTLDEWDQVVPARVIEQHRSEVVLATGEDVLTVSLLATTPELVVGDWLLLDSDHRVLRRLDRKTYFARKAAGSELRKQIISANVDVAFIVSSMNDDFNLNRIERYLSLVNEAGADPVVVLSKSDQVQSPEQFVELVHAIDPYLAVEMVNCLDAESVARLMPWIKRGTTVAVLGSSGVGKSTLINTLLGEQRQSTGEIREDDAKGRHTTTSRSLISMDSGGLLLDTPGMREIQLADAREGIAATFSDIEELASQCKFGDCQHQTEPGCAVQEAIAADSLDQRRLDNYLKLLREESRNTASLAEQRKASKAQGKFYKQVMSDTKKIRGRQD